MGARLFAIADNGHFGALFGMATNGLIDHPTTGHNAADDSFIFTADGSRLQLSNQICVGRKVLATTIRPVVSLSSR